MFWFVLLACNGEKVETPSGKEMINDYFSALCTWYADQECAVEISQCGDPVTSFSDWAQCMNAQNNRINLCGELPALLEESPDAIMSCTTLVQESTCQTEEICSDAGHLLYEGVCGQVEELILQTCSPF